MTVVPVQASQFVTSPILNCPGNPGDITGATDNFLLLTAGGRANYYTTRTAAQLFGDVPGCVPNFTCAVTIICAPTAALVTFFPGSGVEINVQNQAPTASMTIAPGFYREFTLTFISSTVATLQAVGSGPWP